MKIRKAQDKDINMVLDLCKRWKDKESPCGFISPTAKELKDKIGDYFLVAETKNTVVGFVDGTIKINTDKCIFPIKSKYLEIDNIFIQKQHRKGNIGSQLLNAIIQKAKKRKIQRYFIYSSMVNIEPVIKFYRKNKFKSWAIQMYREDL